MEAIGTWADLSSTGLIGEIFGLADKLSDVISPIVSLLGLL